MVTIDTSTNVATRVWFYSPELEKGRVYSSADGTNVTITDLYSGTEVWNSGNTFSQEGFRHNFLINHTIITHVENRKYEVVASLNDDVVFRDTLIFTDQDTSHETDHQFTFNNDQYKYLNRGESVNEYKVLTR